MKHQILFLAILGLGVTCTARAQSTREDACDRQLQAMEQQSAACADYNQQLSDLKVRIAALKDNREGLLADCLKQGKLDQKRCAELASLDTGRLSILNQQYLDLAQHGCQTTPIVSVTNACKAPIQKEEALTSKPKTVTNQVAKPAAIAPAHAKAVSPGDTAPVNVQSATNQSPKQPLHQSTSTTSGTSQTARSAAADSRPSKMEMSGASGMPGSNPQGVGSRPVSNTVERPK
jgi:hypothetical protein